ncbi:conjugal transfer protein TraF [Aliivibrio fischeri]|uniref:conjugal transfer protein TraF n=1 Tax=Aliivibrio fischeri TaxID=668 RepID=UPI0012DACE50|nr:conjugal transfer protein TraF [Aliivibrio fischeri]MUL10701.1 type IX secretion system membrane protein PorP/SprF [Aliivibrio fischeri]MUL13884.1 type IX secretion system membrane protein PorP/SprF [Aliivibrio fischeri]
MKKLTLLSLSIGSVLFSSHLLAANQVADARGNAMGNTGVATADYLVAPFYNPALAASFKDNDDFGLLLPAFNATARDTDDTLTTIDDLQSAIEKYENSGNPAGMEDELNGYLNQLSGNKPLTVTAGLGFAIALPTKTIATNLYGRGYTEIIAAPNITNDSNVEDRYNQSTVDMMAFGYAEFGVAIAKEFTIGEERFSFGVTPKLQQMTTYAQQASVAEFDLEDYDQSEITKNAFNVDLGAVWYKNNFRAALAIKDVISQEIDAEYKGVKDKYELNTQATLGLAYTAELFTVALDADLTKQTRFTKLNDDTQFVRVGVEANAWGWAQLRAGYEIDLEETLENSITAGIGISPFDVVSLDLAGSYAGDNQFGVSGNLAFTF